MYEYGVMAMGVINRYFEWVPSNTWVIIFIIVGFIELALEFVAAKSKK